MTLSKGFYFAGPRSSIGDFAHSKRILTSDVIFVKDENSVKRIAPGNTVYFSLSSIKLAKLYDFCRRRGNLDLQIWTHCL